MLSPFDINVYSPGFQLQRPVTVVSSCDVTPRHNGQGTAQIILAATNEANAALAADGARVTIWARGEHQLSGWVDSEGGTILASGDVSYQIQGDECVLDETQAFVAPGQPIAPASLSSLGQAWQTGTPGPEGTTAGQSGYYVWPDGVNTAEAAIKDLISKNLVQRLGRPYTVLPNLDRGGDARAAGVLPQVRFGTLREAIEPLLEWSGLGLRVWQEPGSSSISVDVYEPVEWPAVLTPDSGIVVDGKYNKTGPTATRVIGGGPGDLADRAFALYVDAALEARFGGRIIEVFKESTSAQLEWPDELADAYRVAKYYSLRSDISADLKAAFARDMKASADAELLDGRPSASLDVELTETEAFRFGGENGIHLGDIVTIETAGGQQFTDHIESATLAVGDSGFTVKPSLGTGTDDEDEEVWRAIARLAAALRSMSTRK